MLKRIIHRVWTDEHGDPRVEEAYECEYGVIWVKPRYHGGGWDKIEEAAYTDALEKYKEVLRENNRLIEVEEKW